MKLRLRWWRELFFFGALLFSLAALLPLRVALDGLGFADKGLAAGQVEGNIWLGRLSDARFGAVPLGHVATRLRAFPLLIGRTRLDLKQDDGLGLGLSLSRHGFGIDDASGTLAGPSLAELPTPTLDLADVSVRFENGLCASAEGLVKARFSGDLGGTPLAGAFSGEARCEGPALLLPLTGQSGTDRLDVRLFADGRYQVDAALRPAGLPFSARYEGRF